MVEIFGLLADKAVSLLREGEKNRLNFLREVAEPLHQKFQTLRTLHDRTFTDVRLQLRTKLLTYDEIARMVVERSIEEAHTWKLFSLLESDVNLSPQSSIRVALSDYLSALSSCTEFLERNGQQQLQKRIYLGLAQALQSSSDEDKVLHEVNRVQEEFTDYCAQVEAHYLALRRVCTR